MMIAFNQMYRVMGDQGFAILAGESFWEFCCVLNAIKASPLFTQVLLPQAQLLPFFT